MLVIGLFMLGAALLVTRRFAGPDGRRFFADRPQTYEGAAPTPAPVGS